MEHNEDETVKVEFVSSESLSTIIKAEVDIQISTAKQYPRSLKVFRDKAMSMATFSEDIAESCSYSLPRGGKSLDGPSVRLAEIVCASYGNIRSGARVIATDETTITAQGFCHDLETNNYVAVEVKRKITDKFGKRYKEDMIVVTGNAACAIAYRNAVFKVVPSALIQDIYDEARKVAKGTAATLVARRTKAVEYFTEQGIKESQICTLLSIQKIEDIDLDKLSTLSGMKASIKNGETTLANLFEPVNNDEALLEDLELLFKMKKEFMEKKDVQEAERILKNKEVASYKKLQTKLLAL